jgi:ABC-2 type transport system ATP-binding protein
MIQILEVSKCYGKLRAVDRLTINVPSGSIFAFLGINGAGKTTTIKMLTGILHPTSGEVRIGGFDINKQPRQAKRLIGYVPDRPHLYPKLTARELLYFVGDLYQVPHHKIDQRIDSLLDEYSLTPWQDTLIEGFSHGMKQRIALCAALVHEPQILIVDEPMVGLDPHGARDLKNAFKRYSESGMTVFLSTHTLNVAEELAHNIAIIHHGRLLTSGSLEEIRDKSTSNDADLEGIFLGLTEDKLTNHARVAFEKNLLL